MHCKSGIAVILVALLSAVVRAESATPTSQPAEWPVSRDVGYEGMWYAPTVRPFLSGVGGGMTFAPADHTPVAQYALAARKTFFVYAAGQSIVGRPGDNPPRMMVGYYDHATGTVPTPVKLVDNLPPGTHGCPSLTLDADGRLWVFIAFIGADRPGLILRSAKPYDIERWEKVAEMDFVSPQPWYLAGQGFLLIHGRKVDGKPQVFFSTSRDGVAWSEPVALATLGNGCTFLSGQYQKKVGVAITYCAEGMPANMRTNLYYLETSDQGKTWQAYPRTPVELPLTTVKNAALVCDFGPRMFYFLNDLAFDGRGIPTVLYVMRHVNRAAPAPESRSWYTSRWAGREWETTTTLYGDNDHDAGCLMTNGPVWTAVLPTGAGPQPRTPGGSLATWRSDAQGRAWWQQPLTQGGAFNHNCVRRVVNGDAGFSLIWADGDGRRKSEARIYFADSTGNVYLLPTKMDGPTVKPELLWKGATPLTQPAEPAVVQAASGPASAPTTSAQ